MPVDEHKVWEFYDFYRTVRLNWKYYKKKLRRFTKLNNTLEILLAVTAPGSAIAGYTVWEEGLGRWVWMILGTAAAIFSLAKPILKINKHVEKLEKATQAYAALHGDCIELQSEIRHKEAYTESMYKQYQKLLKKRNNIKQGLAGEMEDRNLISLLQEEVEEELPSNNFFIPKG